MRTITVSFKAKERLLYEFIAGHSSPAAYLKDLAQRDMVGSSQAIASSNKDSDTPPPLTF